MLSVDEVLITPELSGRPARPHDHAAEARALGALADALATEPRAVLQKLTAAVVDLRLAESAGVSIMEGEEPDRRFRWPAVSGRWAGKTGGVMPIDASPCAVVIARDETLLFEDPERFFPAARQDPRISEILLVPFHVAGAPAGTLWAIAHSPDRKFDREDARLLETLARFAAVAHRMTAALDEAEAGRRDGERRVEERTRALAESDARFRQFGENSGDALWIVDAGTRRVEYVSAAFERIWGEPADRVLGDPARWSELVHPDDLDRALSALPTVLEGGRADVDYRVVRPDGGVRWIRDVGFPIRDGEGRIVRAAGIAQDVTERKRAEDALADSERRFRVLTEGIPQLVWRSCGEGLWTWSSRQWRDFTGQTQEESHGRGWLHAIHPDDHARTLAAWEEARPHGELDVEYRVRRARDGAWIWHQTRSVPVRDAEGRIVEWLGTSTDVQDMRELQEHQRLLLGELQHRVRNSLAVVRSIARRTAAGSATVEDFALHLDGRLSAFGRTQAAVTRDPGRGVDLRALIGDELAAVAAREGHLVRVEGPDIRLQPKAAETLALAFHELATNAVKYGALSDGGLLTVDWRVDDARLLVDWRERLPGREVAPPDHRGFGTELLEQTLEYELEADVSLLFEPSGVHCRIALPLANITA